MRAIASIIDRLSDPAILFSITLVLALVVFPPTRRLRKVHDLLRVDRLWTNAGGVVLLLILLAFFGLGLTDPDFAAIATKPDNIPITALMFVVIFFLWFAMKQARANDQRIAAGKKPAEAEGGKVLVWPDLVYVEFISLILISVLLVVWSIGLKAPLEEPANPTVSPNPSKAPWYFLGLQEMLVYFDPWIAGVVFPTLIIVGLMAIPYLDERQGGQGYFSFAERGRVMSVFMFGWLALWVFLIYTGTFLRGPNWNFFGPFETWDVNKRVVLNNINLSEIIYVQVLGVGLPRTPIVREAFGFAIVLGYFLILPGLLAKTVFKELYERLGRAKYGVMIVLFLSMLSLPLKMYSRWLFNLKYVISIPEVFFNI